MRGEGAVLLNKDGQLLCFAYEDFAADRQLRMLRELEQFSEILDFRKLFPEYKGVTIYDCNELAYFFALYLKKQGIPVNVWGGGTGKILVNGSIMKCPITAYTICMQRE